MAIMFGTVYRCNISGRSDGEFYSLLLKALCNEHLEHITFNADSRDVDSICVFCKSFDLDCEEIRFIQKPSTGELFIFLNYDNRRQKMITLENVEYRRTEWI